MEIQSSPPEFSREDERGYPRLMIECAADDPRVAGWRDVCIHLRRPFAIVSGKPGGYATVHLDIDPLRYQWRRETVSLNPVLREEAGAVLSFMVGESDHPMAEFTCTTTAAHAEYVLIDRAIAFARWLAASVMSDGKNQRILRDVVPLATVIDLDSWRKPRTSLRERAREIDGGPVDWGDVS